MRLVILIGIYVASCLIFLLSGFYIGKHVTESDIERNKRVIIEDFLRSLERENKEIIKFGKYVFLKSPDGSIKIVNTHMNFMKYEFIINGNIISIKKKEEKNE